jgi:hypothetical protein
MVSKLAERKAKTIILISMLVIIALCILFGTVYGAEAKSIEVRHQRPVSCASVREVVVSVGEAEAERLARMLGATEARLAAARRCIKR